MHDCRMCYLLSVYYKFVCFRHGKNPSLFAFVPRHYGMFFAAAGIYCLWIEARRCGLKILLTSIILFGSAVVVYVWRQYLLQL